METVHLALPRKWRPRTFDSLVGQEAAVRTLTHALADGKVSHAYLLTGPRGVGKTTTARLLAMCLNCAKGPAIVPCGQCASCREIAERGDSLDTIEMDAASNRSVDDARELLEILRYRPQRDRYRILILDEVHMLTKEAFNALLKTLEEPPEYAVFILASTELARIPATIVSRCQRFSFRRLGEEEMAGRLAEVAQHEGISVTPGALAQITRAADGSLRDALSLLDQAATTGEGKVDEKLCTDIFAFVDRGALISLFGAVMSGDRAGVAAFLARAREEGLDPRHGCREFLLLLRQKLLESAAGREESAPYESLLRAVALAIETERELARAVDPWLVWELSLLKKAELPRLRQIEEILESGPALPPRDEGAAMPRPPKAPASEGPRFVSLVPEPTAEFEAPPQPPASPVDRFRELVTARRVAAGTYLASASRIEEAGEELQIEFPVEAAVQKDFLSRPDAGKFLAEAAAETFGRKLSVRLILGPPADGNLARAAAEVPAAVLKKERAAIRAEKDPMVQMAISLFKGEILETKLETKDEE